MTRTNSVSADCVNSTVVVLPISMAALWSRTSLIREFWEIVQFFGAWPGARVIEGRTGLTLAVNDVKLGHLKWGGQLVLPFGRDARTQIADERIGFDEPDEYANNVMAFNIRGQTDVDRALCLLRFAYLISDLDQDECRASRAVDLKVSTMRSFE